MSLHADGFIAFVPMGLAHLPGDGEALMLPFGLAQQLFFRILGSPCHYSRILSTIRSAAFVVGEHVLCQMPSVSCSLHLVQQTVAFPAPLYVSV